MLTKFPSRQNVFVQLKVPNYFNLFQTVIKEMKELKKNKIMKIRTHRSGLASILLKKSPPVGCKELINLFKTMSVSTLKYCVYDETLNTPLQLFAGCCSNLSAG